MNSFSPTVTPSQSVDPMQSNAALMVLARTALLQVLVKGEFPVGVRLDDGKLLVVELVVDAGAMNRLCATSINSENGQKAPIDVAKLGSQAWMRLIEEGIRGKALSAAMDPSAGDTAFSDYKALLTSLEKSGIVKSFELLAAYCKLTDGKKGLLGKIYSEPCADGSACYMVTQINAKSVRLQHVPVGDAWSVPHLGQDGWAPIELVNSKIESRKAWGQFPQTNTYKQKAGMTPC